MELGLGVLVVRELRLGERETGMRQGGHSIWLLIHFVHLVARLPLQAMAFLSLQSTQGYLEGVDFIQTHNPALLFHSRAHHEVVR